jgi:hypothetical protein
MVMANLIPPFLANENGDVTIYRTLDDIAAHVEAVDVRNGAYDFYDSRGQVILASISADRVALATAPQDFVHPERLESVLRRYFARLPRRFSEFSELASGAATLADLVSLRERLADTRSRGFGWTR